MILGVLAILLACTMLGSAGVFIKKLDLPLLVIAWFRLGIPFLVIFLTQKELRQKLLTQPNKKLLLTSCLTAVRILFVVFAFYFASMSKAIILIFSYPLILCLFGYLFYQQKVSRRTLFLIGIAFVGVLIIFLEETAAIENKEWLGLLFAFLIAVIYAGVLLIFKKEMQKSSPYEIILYDNLAGGIIFLPFFIRHLPSISLQGLSMGIVYGLFIGLFCFLFFLYGLSKLKAATVSLLSYTEVVSACLFGVFFFQETLTPQFFIGAGLILFSVAFVKKN